MSDVDLNRLLELGLTSSNCHYFLVQATYEFSTLYCIRDYEHLDHYESLSQAWDEFGFDVPCPESIETQEIYIIWIKELLGKEDISDDVISQLEELRKNDDLSDSEYNVKWLEFVKDLIFSIEKWASTGALNLFILYLYFYRK